MLLDVEGAEEQLATGVERIAAQGEAVEVIIEPSKRGLQYPVDNVEGEVGANVETPPDWGAGPYQVNPYPIDGGPAASGPPKTGPVRSKGLTPDPLRHVEGQLVQIIEAHTGEGRFELAEKILRIRTATCHSPTVPIRTRQSPLRDPFGRRHATSPAGEAGLKPTSLR